MVEFSSYKRNTVIDAIKQENLDILVVGGGITGAGIALDAITRGLNVAVIEMQDFAAGTSSKSTKLVHGGLRYLQQFEIKLVAEVGKERAIVYENGPHVTKPEWMMLPFHKGGNFGPLSTSVGLKVYDFLAGVKKGERRQMLNPKEAINKEPLINQNDLKGAGYYVEYKTDDARLTIEILKKAIEQGAHAVNYMKAVYLLYDESGKVCGIKARDEISGELHEVYAKKIVSATGPWLDDLREIDHSKKGKTLHLTKGVHLVFSQEDFPLKQAIYFDSPDERMIFAIPRQNKVYVGTTDTYYKADVINPKTTAEDRDYVIHAINSMFPSLKINKSHVESNWAGVRALFSDGNDEKPGEISRKDEIFISETGLISMAGGKLTGYRKMAEEAVNTVLRELKHEGLLYDAPSQTRYLPISGGDVGGSEGFKTFKQEKLSEGMDLGLSKYTVTRLIDLYGSNISILFNIYQDNKEKEMDIDPLVLAELKYGMNYELVYKPVDFFIRRTSALFFDIDWVKQHKQPVVNYMAQSLNWTKDQKEQYTVELNLAIKEAELNT